MNNTVMQFRARADARPRGGLAIALPFDPDAAWGARDRHHVTGSVNGFRVRGPLAAEGDSHVLRLGAAWCRDNGLLAGAEVAVTLAPEGPQSELLPDDIAAAFDAEPEARAFFDALATFYRKAYLRWVDATRRRPDLRAERIAEMVRLLKAGVKDRRT
jgi:hypothetical protein